MSCSLKWEGAVEGYVVNTMKTQYFRVQRTLTRDEYVNEAFIVFSRVQTKYKKTVDEDKHLMALFKTAWSRRLNDLSTEDTHQRMFVQAPITRSSEGEDIEGFDPVGDLDNDGMLAIVIREAPQEIKQVLNLFLAAPQEILDVALAGWSGQDRRCKAGGSARICKLLGLPEDRDIMQEVEAYFTN